MNGVSPLCSTLNRLIDQFNQRMEDVSGKGLSIATDQAILSLHQDLTALHIQLLQQIDETQEKKCEEEREGGRWRGERERERRKKKLNNSKILYKLTHTHLDFFTTS